MDSGLDLLVQRYLDGTITPEEMRSLNRLLGAAREARCAFRRHLDLDSALATLAAGVVGGTEQPSASCQPQVVAGHAGPGTVPATVGWWSSRSVRTLRDGLVATTIGVLLGIAGTRWVSAVVSPFAGPFVERTIVLWEDGFEGSTGPVPNGFPEQSGHWGGDETEIATLPAEFREEKGKQSLRFGRSGADVGNPQGPSISCDVFQIVDLAALRASPLEGGEPVLELSADFLDGRSDTGEPITFICQIFLFKGDFDLLRRVWPRTLGSALGSGATLLDSSGDVAGWRTLTARCLLHPQADFAVVQLGALPHGSRRELPEQYADRVRLSLRLSPHVPVDRPQR